MKPQLINIILVVLMFAASGLATVMRPTDKISTHGKPMELEVMVPRSFGEWHEVHEFSPLIIDPNQQKSLDKIYSQLLSRTYVNSNGYRIMVSLAYGDDQRDGMQLHYPEVCYPAQGFQVISKKRALVHLPEGKLPVMQLETALGSVRSEPVTYWTMIGDIASVGGAEKKIAELHFGLRGMIPDGLLFRVSSLDEDSRRAFEMHEVFIADILSEMPSPIRKRFSGI